MDEHRHEEEASVERTTLAPRSVVPASGGPLTLHVVLRGTFTLSTRAGGALPLSCGDVVIVPPGEPVTLRCEGDEPGELLRAVYPAEAAPVDGVRVAHGAAGERGLRALVGLVGAELREGDAAMARRLLGPLLGYAVRASEGRAPELLDSVIADAVARLRARPEHAWTIDELAKHAGLSRSAFTRRFAREVGAPPLRWLATWRMRLAARRLAEGDDSLAQIAAEVGYESEFSFSRAFKRHHGVPPGAFRRAHHGLRRRDEPMLRAA